MKNYSLKEELRNAIINYLSTKPYNQVMSIITVLTSDTKYSSEELNSIVNYLATTSIYIEVYRLIDGVREEFSEQDRVLKTNMTGVHQMVESMDSVN